MASTKPFVHGACDVLCLCLIQRRWHNVIVLLFLNPVTLSVTRISVGPVFAIQFS